MEAPDWTQIKGQLDLKYHIHASDAGKRFMWVIVGIFPFTIILHILSAVKRGQRAGFWFVRRDAEGYIFENRHVVVHTLSAFKTLLACIAVIFLQQDIQTHVRPYCVAFQASGFAVMHIQNWHRTWCSIYSMPPTSLHLSLKQGPRKNIFNQSDRAMPPWLFNFGLVGGSLYGIILTLASTAIICTSINRDNSLYRAVSDILDENISLARDPTPESKILMMQNGALLLSGIENMKSESLRIFHAFQYLVCGFVAINFISVTLYWWSLHAIIRCLDKQLSTYRQCLQNRDEAIQLGMISMCPGAITFDKSRETLDVVKTKKLDADDAPLPSDASQMTRVSSTNLMSWLPTFKGDDISADHLIWKSAFMRSIKPEGSSYKARLRSEHSILQRCKVNTIWQAVFITIMSMSYISMASTLGANAFDVPQRTSITQLGYYVILWSNSIWVVGGTGLAMLSARVALLRSYTSMSQQASAEAAHRTESFDY
ncbi:hypothetical protein PtA15_10A103 [Puccinia triticina]|uniref:Uncharacterized protein n=1 Tax=Puccinia triticina TaxID=208348 RepID=A0ABY7CTV3_9BASI|nr:uncharacterized protein PtA15_10A103 [Puccinia triticina]WAQ88684.1 hypothetical protein PtA15_10A103 [Puccinia triticina]